MTKDNIEVSEQENPNEKITRKRFKFCLYILIIFTAIGIVLTFAFNNFSLCSDKKFSSKLDKAIEKAVQWVHNNETEILKVKNVALIKMLQDCNVLYPAGNFGIICDKFMSAPASPACWKAFIDRNYPVNKWELNQTIKNEGIDNKWTLYAIAPEKADTTPEKLELYSPEKWNGRQLTHQLWALIQLRKTQPKVNNEELINHLCSRITHQLTLNITVVDIYIQKIAFVLYADHPEKIRRRWIERVIDNQQSDGGWNDRWLCFESRKRPVFSLEQPTSNQHATIQALWLLCQVKYRYPQYFGMDRQN